VSNTAVAASARPEGELPVAQKLLEDFFAETDRAIKAAKERI
jgi:hypothetical protein